MKLEPLIISAPFGNYVQPKGTTPTLGTFTAARRPGRLWRILRTVRYYPRLGAWVNKIGLRNPGIDWLTDQVRSGKINVDDKLISIHGFTELDWWKLIERAAALKPLAIELNMSCPNVGHINWPAELFTRAINCGTPIIIKLPPVNHREMSMQALHAGIRTFHCCNTIPIPAGGVSGKPLKPVALQCIGDLRNLAAELGHDSTLRIIGGGGITTPDDVADYHRAGAHHIAIGTKVMNPMYLFSHRGIEPLLEAAKRGVQK